MKQIVLKSLLAGTLFLTAAATSTTSVVAQTVQVRGVDHVGLTVPDMDAAVKFFSSTFGFTAVTEMRDIPVDDGFRTTFHMHPGTKVKSIVMLRAGNSANLELFQYDSPDSSKEQPYYDDAGSAHVAFYTDDMTASVAALRAQGVKVLTDPIVMTQGPTAGETWAYFLTPWGSKLELTTYPTGKAYEKQAGITHLWTPSISASSNASATTSKITVAEVQAFTEHYLPLFNETDARKRLVGVNQYFAQDVAFLDPEGGASGTEALNNLITKLLDTNRGWHFSQRGAVEVTSSYARVPWQYGPASDPKRVLGEDVFLLRNGKIASLTTFVSQGK